MDKLLPDWEREALQRERDKLGKMNQPRPRDEKRIQELDTLLGEQTRLKALLAEQQKYRNYSLPTDKRLFGRLRSVMGSGEPVAEQPAQPHPDVPVDSIIAELSSMVSNVAEKDPEEGQLEDLLRSLQPVPAIAAHLAQRPQACSGEKLSLLIHAFSKHVLHPAGRAILAVPDKLTGLPKVIHAHIRGSWREYRAPIGASARATYVEWQGDGGEAARTADQDILIDTACIARDALDHYTHILKRTNPIDCLLGTFIRETGMTAAQYAELIEEERYLCEEIEHAHDHSFLQEYAQAHPDAPHVHDVTRVPLFLRQPDNFAWNYLIQKHKNTGSRDMVMVAIKEVSAQMSGIARQMKVYLDRGECDAAYLVFLNFASHMVRLRNDFQRCKFLLDAGQIAPALFYGMAAERNLAGFEISDLSATGIVRHCETGPRHPGEIGFDLVETSRQRNVLTLAQRMEALQ